MMNRGLGSIMGYRGGGMPVARFQEGGLTQADRDRIILEYTQAVYAQPGITPQAAAAQIAAAMDQFDVSPEEYAGAFQRDTSIVTPEQRDIFGNVGTIQQSYEAVRPEGEYSAAARAAAAEAEAIQRIAGGYADQLFGALRSGDREAALAALTGAQRDFPTYDAFEVAAANIPGAGLDQDLFRNISGGDDVVTAEELRSYLALTGTDKDTDTVIDTSTKGREELTGGATFTGPGRYSQVPEYTRQQASGFSFAPIQRGLGQLRGPAFMPGLLQGTESFGGTGLSQDLVREGIIDYSGRLLPEGTPNAEEINRGVIRDYVLNEMIPQGLSPAEVAAASPTLSLGATQQYYNQFAPQGVFSTAAPGRTVLPEDFVLQTGAYTTPVTAVNPTRGTTLVEEGYFGGPDTSPEPELRSGGVIKMAEGGEAQESGGDAASNISTYIDRLIASGGTGEDIKGAMNLYGVTPEQVREAYPQFSLEELIGNYENLQASPAERIRAFEKRYSTEEAVRQAGSKFDVADYLDEQGRLVSGYSKPMYDKFNRFIGYEYKPYESNVVFGEELRRKEAAMRPTDEEREQMMVEMAMRQGRTGISPTTGGLAGIEIGDPMMRNRPQYYSTVEQFRPRYAKGGIASIAEELASKGRGGDSMLVHMAPHEVAGLNAIARMQGTELTINPETGMPEALKLGKLFKMLAPFVPFIPGVGQFLAPAFGALGMGGFSPLLQKAITSGVIGGFTGPKGGFDLQRGLMQGITAYGLGSLQQNLAGPSTPGGPPTPGGPVNVDPSMGGVPPPMTGQNPLAGMEYMNTPVTGGNPLEGSQFINTIQTPGDITAASKAAEATRAVSPLADIERGGVPDLSAPFEYQPVSPENAATTASGMKTPTALLTTGLGVSSTADYDKLTSAGIAVKREKEEEDELYRRLFERSLGAVPVRSGGLMKLAGGGMTYMEAGGTTGPTGTPRDVTGTGDGMSDSVPATIEGVQEARLADGEFVIPADVVADIGNGSSDAGSKKLYDMMDRVRMARHGTTEQPPEIKAERLMPA